MTTDNRTNEPTEAMVEAAAEAIHNLMQGDPRFKDSGRKREMRIYARAALVAAQGAAPQAESDPLREALRRAREHFTAIAASGEIRVWEDTGERLGIDSQTRGWAKRGERICLEALAAPVLPSSTVGEFRFTDAQWREYQSIPMQGYSHRGHLEHVFNEWLKEQGR